jgi:hypothetical protein
MAFLRFSRDKRGYEHFYLVEPPRGRERSRGRVLYWFRTPPNIKVGREPFDPETRRALAAHYPNVDFDWKKIGGTPVPPADTEPWHERREAARAARAARTLEDRVAEPEELVDEQIGTGASGGITTTTMSPVAEDSAHVDTGSLQPSEPDPAAGLDAASSSAGTAASPRDGAGGRRRRRRGRRRRPAREAAPASAQSERVAAPQMEPVAPSTEVDPPEPSSARGGDGGGDV